MKDIIMEVELQQRNHQLDDLLRVLDETFLQLFSIAHLRKNRFNYILQVTFTAACQSFGSLYDPKYF